MSLTRGQLAAAHPHIAEKFRVETQSRVFQLEKGRPQGTPLQPRPRTSCCRRRKRAPAYARRPPAKRLRRNLPLALIAALSHPIRKGRPQGTPLQPRPRTSCCRRRKRAPAYARRPPASGPIRFVGASLAGALFPLMPIKIQNRDIPCAQGLLSPYASSRSFKAALSAPAPQSETPANNPRPAPNPSKTTP